MTTVERPIVRSFAARFSKECAAWVRSGGHAVYWETPKNARLVMPKPKKAIDGDAESQDLGTWSALDLGISRTHTHARGPFAGLASVRVPTSCNDIVKHRASRDSIHEGPTRTVSFDCLECAACCKDNEVILEPADFKRFEKGGRPELGKKPLAARRAGKMVLTLLANDRCRHLARDNKCGIYTLRPNACREFPVASECCLYARKVELGILDGADD